MEDWIKRTWKGYGPEVFLTPRVGDIEWVCRGDVSSQNIIKDGYVCMKLNHYLRIQPAFETQLSRLRSCNVIEYKNEIGFKPSALHLLDCDRQRRYRDYELMNGSLRIP